MKELKDYIVIQEQSADNLASRCLEKAKDGYELHGHLISSGEYQYQIFIQAMVKYN